MNEDQELHNLSKKIDEAETKALLLLRSHMEMRQTIRTLCNDLIDNAEKTNDIQMLLKIRELVLESCGGDL